jgi:hypothetical protein
MPYTIEIADAVVRTIGKFVTLNNFQLAGHVANLEFWTEQVKSALQAIDGYPKRQRALEGAQKEYIKRHDTREVDAETLALHREFPNDPCYVPPVVAPNRNRIDSETIKAKRREVVDSFYRFICRCHREGILQSSEARRALGSCGIGVEPGDLRD